MGINGGGGGGGRPAGVKINLGGWAERQRCKGGKVGVKVVEPAVQVGAQRLAAVLVNFVKCAVTLRVRRNVLRRNRVPETQYKITRGIGI